MGRTQSRRAAAALGAAVALALAACEPGPLVGADPPGRIRLSLFAVGDTGAVPGWLGRSLEPQMLVARAIEAEHRRRPADALVLLGDNFYPEGLRADELEWRIRENLVRPYCALLKLDGPESPRIAGACDGDRRTERPVPIYAVLGNHDVKLPESPRLQREVVPRFVPNWRLHTQPVELVELLDADLETSVSLVLYDAIALADAGDVEPLRRALERARGRFRILAGHYPLHASHPGPWIRRTLDAIGVPVHLHLAGHEHNLQIGAPAPASPFLQVVAGSGSGVRRVKHPLDGARFAAVQPGFARIDLVGEGADARLVATLVALPASHLEPWAAPRAVARWSVDAAGDVREEPVPGA
jgi:hypothetical protein